MDIYFFEKYFIECVENIRILKNVDVFNSRDEIYLVNTEKM